MKTHALKALTNPRSVVKAVTVDSSAHVPDPLAFLFERHRHNPFVQFLRAAFFYDDADHDQITRDRVPADKSYRGHFHGRLKF